MDMIGRIPGMPGRRDVSMGRELALMARRMSRINHPGLWGRTMGIVRYALDRGRDGVFAVAESDLADHPAARRVLRETIRGACERSAETVGVGTYRETVLFAIPVTVAGHAPSVKLGGRPIDAGRLEDLFHRHGVVGPHERLHLLPRLYGSHRLRILPSGRASLRDAMLRGVLDGRPPSTDALDHPVFNPPPVHIEDSMRFEELFLVGVFVAEGAAGAASRMIPHRAATPDAPVMEAFERWHDVFQGELGGQVRLLADGRVGPRFEVVCGTPMHFSQALDEGVAFLRALRVVTRATPAIRRTLSGGEPVEARVWGRVRPVAGDSLVRLRVDAIGGDPVYDRDEMLDDFEPLDCVLDDVARLLDNPMVLDVQVYAGPQAPGGMEGPSRKG